MCYNIKSGTLEVIEGCNGYYLYGKKVNGETVCIACLGDGSDGPPAITDMSESAWAEAYAFVIC